MTRHFSWCEKNHRGTLNEKGLGVERLEVGVIVLHKHIQRRHLGIRAQHDPESMGERPSGLADALEYAEKN